MKSHNFDKLKNELLLKLSEIKYKGDISDIGNEIGIVIEKYFDKESNTLEAFISSVKHGVSLMNGTH